ncbi:MAG: L,D-transpeptidase [Pseudonocardiaceae bacterium]
MTDRERGPGFHQHAATEVAGEGEREMAGVPAKTIIRSVATGAGGLLGAAVLLLAGATSAPVTASAATSGAPCGAAARACVDLSTQQAWLMSGGTVSYGPVPVATGKASAPTNPGTFQVFWKDLHHRSTEFHNAPMPYSVFFNGGDAFHEDSVTVPSNGCVHLTLSAAQTFYNTLQVGDVVQVVR